MAFSPAQFAQKPATLDAEGEALTMDVSTAAGASAIWLVQLAGTFGATVTFEGTLDGSNWVAILVENQTDGSVATTATAAGLYRTVVSGLAQVRARVSAYTSGTVSAAGMVVA